MTTRSKTTINDRIWMIFFSFYWAAFRDPRFKHEKRKHAIGGMTFILWMLLNCLYELVLLAGYPYHRWVGITSVIVAGVIAHFLMKKYFTFKRVEKEFPKYRYLSADHYKTKIALTVMSSMFIVLLLFACIALLRNFT